MNWEEEPVTGIVALLVNIQCSTHCVIKLYVLLGCVVSSLQLRAALSIGLSRTGRRQSVGCEIAARALPWNISEQTDGMIGSAEEVCLMLLFAHEVHGWGSPCCHVVPEVPLELQILLPTKFLTLMGHWIASLSLAIDRVRALAECSTSLL